MALILLIRHAENHYMQKGRLAGRIPQVFLNERGKEQALQLADTLANLPLKAIYSSPLERAQQTIQPLATRLNLPVVIRPALIEVDFGDWQGKSLKQLARLRYWKVIQQTPSRAYFPGGESFQQAQSRLVTELEWLRSQHTEQEMIAVVSHSDPIKLAIAYFIGLPMDAFQRLQISPASITILALGELSIRLLALNFDLQMVTHIQEIYKTVPENSDKSI